MLSRGASEETNPTDILDLGPPAFRNCEKINFCCLSCSVYGTLLRSSSKLIQRLYSPGLPLIHKALHPVPAFPTLRVFDFTVTSKRKPS